MARQNYNKMSKPKTEQPAEVEVTEAAEVNEVTESVEPAKKIDFITGKVANCVKLNIRVKPSKEAKIDRIVDAGFEVKINEEKSTDGWYFVSFKGGKGYCMKDFIEIDS